MAAVLGSALQTNSISVRYLLSRVCRLKYGHKVSFRQNYGFAKLRLMNFQPELNVQIRNGKVRYLIINPSVPNP